MSRHSQNRARYNAVARVYEAWTRIGTLGGISQLYRAVAEELEPIPGGTLVEFGCGPASVTPYLLPKVGPSGRIIGVDIAEEMVAKAREKAEEEGWQNVQFEHCDTLDYKAPSAVDAVVFCLSLSAMPDCSAYLEKAMSVLAPGGQLLIVDSIPDPSRRLVSLMIRLKAPLVGSYPQRVPIEFARSRLEAVRVEPLLGGVYTLISGRAPGGSA